MLLNLLIFLPIVGGLLCLPLGRRSPGGATALAVVTAAAAFALSLALWGGFNPNVTRIQAETNLLWVPALGIHYHVGVDGLSLLLIVTTALTGLVAVLAARTGLIAERRLGDYCGLVLILQGTITGAFAALDLILFFAFWEAMLIPMYLVVGMLGGPRRIHAAFKFFLYTAVGSLLMLVGMLYVYFYHLARTGTGTFDLPTLLATPVPVGVQPWIFLVFALAFAIKVPIFPLHSWLPDTYTQSPLPALVIGTMLVKVGAYGFLRFCLPLFPNALTDAAPALALLGTVGIIYGGFVAVAQRDMVRLLAFSSVAHLGFVVLGIFSLDPRGVQGALLQMVNHSLTAGALFLIAAMLLRRTDTSAIEAMRGLAGRYPVLAALFLVSMFASLGLPGLNGFVGEILIIIGSWPRYPALAVLAALGTILSVVYLLWWYRRVMHGHPERPPAEEAPGERAPLKGHDLTRPELATLVPLVVLMFIIGLFPAPFLQTSEATVSQLLQDGRRATVTNAWVADPVTSSALSPEKSTFFATLEAPTDRGADLSLPSYCQGGPFLLPDCETPPRVLPMGHPNTIVDPGACCFRPPLLSEVAR